MKLLDEKAEISIPKINFGFPEEYLSISEGLKEFLMMEAMNKPVEAYDLISFYMDLSINSKLVKENFEVIREIITIKGIFYEAMLV